MNALEYLKTAGVYVTAGVGIAVGGSVAIVAAPVVSLVVAPIFALDTTHRWYQVKSLHGRTLTNGLRAKFGRVEGQDYTRWDGKAVPQITDSSLTIENAHERMSVYPHGYVYKVAKEFTPFMNNPEMQALDCPFETEEDLEWLEAEYNYLENNESLDSSAKITRAFSKTVFPVGGLVWWFLTELDRDGASELLCCGCGSESENQHWDWKEALTYHKSILAAKLNKS